MPGHNPITGTKKIKGSNAKPHHKFLNDVATSLDVEHVRAKYSKWVNQYSDRPDTGFSPSETALSRKYTSVISHNMPREISALYNGAGKEAEMALRQRNRQLSSLPPDQMPRSYAINSRQRPLGASAITTLY